MLLYNVCFVSGYIHLEMTMYKRDTATSQQPVCWMFASCVELHRQ